jgi:hypothetical protein
VRRLAALMDLPNKDRKDSQGICFLGKVTNPILGFLVLLDSLFISTITIGQETDSSCLQSNSFEVLRYKLLFVVKS